ncbi:MAG: hypothetical protein PUJ51_24195 [Clostridiales bacterium]|jgi:hypothetical protein|uniref:hypothetical protein n=1 Tax=Dialister succinatiphilus TaxID=487173 RepID=UPI0015AC3803|nr:hypothetical protein [Clostridiales bacterium]DAU68955.1 MAG TPA: hypothetical protein [Caudoviricetes sp.]
MNKYLVSATEVYRVDNEESAAALIDEAKAETKYILAKYSSVKKEKKAKGEIVDEWYQVTLVKKFNDEKDPISNIDVNYEVSF